LTARLITIPFSHYCEKARWAADYVGLAYREDAFIPGAHLLATRRAGGRTVPVLVTSDRAYTDSSDILAFLDSVASDERKLYPARASERRDVEAFEDACNRELGPATRLVAYSYGLRDPRMLMRRVAPSLGRAQRVAMRFTFPLVGRLIRRRYRVNDENAARARETTERVFATASERLARMPFLGGDRFGAADLTFAALAAPAVMPPGHPSFDTNATDLTREQLTLRATPAGAYVLRLYREHREHRAPARRPA